MSLVTVAGLRKYLPDYKSTSGDRDAELQELIDQVEPIVAEWLGFPVSDAGAPYSLEVNTYTQYIESPDPENSCVINVELRPIVSVISIHADVNRKYGSDTLIDSSEYQHDKDEEIFLETDASGSFATGFRANKIVLTAGYTTADKNLIRALCIWMSQGQRSKDSQGMKSQKVGDDSTTWLPNNMPPEVRAILQPLQATAMVG